MGHKRIKEKSLAVVPSNGEPSLERYISPEDALMEISATDFLVNAPILPNDKSTTRQQGLIAVDEKVRSLGRQMTNTQVERPAGTLEKPDSNTLKNPANIVWRSLMLDP